MSNRSDPHTCEAPGFADDADAGGRAETTCKSAPFDSSSLARRIHDNLNWAHLFDAETSITSPIDVWQEIKNLWSKPDREFATGLFEVLLGRSPESSASAAMCLALAQGTSRFALVRAIALSDEAALSQVNVSWLAQLDDLESDALWEKMQALWAEPDRAFVAGLYPLLLVRPPEWVGVAAHCRAMKAGATRACVIRAIALSDEAQIRGLSLSWLPRLETLPSAPPRPSRLAPGWLNAAVGWWRKGQKSVPIVSGLNVEAALRPVGATAEGGRS